MSCTACGNLIKPTQEVLHFFGWLLHDRCADKLFRRYSGFKETGTEESLHGQSTVSQSGRSQVGGYSTGSRQAAVGGQGV